jgi:hypothetical protein
LRFGLLSEAALTRVLARSGRARLAARRGGARLRQRPGAARNHFDLDTGEAVVSAIFDWYREDFETEERTLADYIAQYVDSPEVADVLRDGRLELRFAPYDWGSNGRALRCD